MLTTHEQSARGYRRPDGRDRPQGARRRRARSPSPAPKPRTPRSPPWPRPIQRSEAAILEANAIDVANGEEAGLSPAMMDRLKLTPARIKAMADGISEIAALKDPVGEVIAEWDRPNGLHIERVRTPLGVIGVIYESRPNVTADAGALCLKAGNPVILRGGSDSLNSSAAIHACLVEGLKAAEPARGCDPARAGDRPRRGRRDARRPRRQSRRDHSARRQKPRRARAEGGARACFRASRRHLPSLHRPLGQARHGGRDRRQRQDAPHRHLRRGRDAAGRPRGRRHASGADPRRARQGRLRNPRLGRSACRLPEGETRDRRRLDDRISRRDHFGEAGRRRRRRYRAHRDPFVAPHRRRSSRRTPRSVERFFSEINSAILLHNASTQFADGGEFGMGAEIGIATGKMHARGPVGVEQLTSFKYRVRGTGQMRQ